jgi:acyl-CoA synthetase (AMP-forming)/AMP-acid ligase II
VRTRDAVRVEIGAVWDRLELVDADSVLCVSSIAHSYGLVGGLLTPLARGIPVCLAGDVPSVKECLARGPTIVFGLGPLYQALVDSGDPYELRDAFRSVRLSLSAGAPLPPGLFDRFAACTGLPIRQDYGTTETGTIAIQTEDVPNPEKVGVPLSHIEVRLGTQSGESDGPDRRGEVQVRSMAVAAGYVTGGVLIPCTDEEGWYHTRDRASTGGGGELCLVGRLREPIVTVGGVVQPERVESVIRSKPGVREVVVLATRERPNRVMAVVEASDLLHREALLAWCRSHLAQHEVPAELDLRSELPRSPAGKVLQKYLV